MAKRKDEDEVTAEPQAEQEGEYRPTRGVLAQEGYEGQFQEDAETDE